MERQKMKTIAAIILAVGITIAATATAAACCMGPRPVMHNLPAN